MPTIGKIVRYLKEAPVLNELYRQYTEFKIARTYRKREPQDVFTEINISNKWVGKESVSGIGSDKIQTQHIIKEIPILLRQLGINSILDLPCGDHNWMKDTDISGIRYIGGDIVKALIEYNTNNFANDFKSFILADLTKDELPEAELILVRDCLVHLSFDKINMAIANIKRSKIKYILTTTFPYTKRNYDITTGNWRPLNLLKPPFNFPEPQLTIVEHCTESYGQYGDKALGLWDINLLPDKLSL